MTNKIGSVPMFIHLKSFVTTALLFKRITLVAHCTTKFPLFYITATDNLKFFGNFTVKNKYFPTRGGRVLKFQ